MINKTKLVLGSIGLILAGFLVSQAVSAASLESLLAQGTTRYAVVSSTTNASTTSNSFVDLPGVSTTINIPSGKKGDVIITFCGESLTDSFTLVQALIGTAVASPGTMQIRENTSTGGSESQCVNFFKTGVSSGTKTVKIQWEGAPLFPGQQQQMFHRSMIVIVNTH